MSHAIKRITYSAAVLSLLATTALAQESLTNIQGGGATVGGGDYLNELSTFNSSQAAGAATFNNADADNGFDALYWQSGSSTGQSALLDNNNNENCLKVLGSISSFCANNTPGGVNAVHYATSDATFSTTQIAAWATSTYGATVSGHLIQVPSFGLGLSIPVVNSKVTKNGATTAHRPVTGGITLTDDDLCGIFSGKIYDWSQTSAHTKVAPGLITVVYRNDGSGSTFLLLNHFAAVCTAANSSFATLPVVPTSTFANLFIPTGGTTPVFPIPPGQTTTNFLGEKGSSGVANTLANLNGVTVTSAIGYVSPDYTTVAPNSDAKLSNGLASPLVVAGIKLGNFTYIPDIASVASALNHGVIFNPAGPTAPPTSATAGAQTSAYVPLIETVSIGYPIVGYSMLDFAQCYASAAITSGILSFLSDHYSSGSAYASIINRNGFVSIAKSGAKAFSPVILAAIQTNTKKWNDNIGNTKVCAGLTGR